MTGKRIEDGQFVANEFVDAKTLIPWDRGGGLRRRCTAAPTVFMAGGVKWTKWVWMLDVCKRRWQNVCQVLIS